LHRLLKNTSRFLWSEEAQLSFDRLKEALTSPPILAMPVDGEEFVLDTDASNFAIGAVLSQVQNGVERVVAYGSRALDRREQNYCVTRKELLAVVYFMRLFKQYLLGARFRVRTDHAALSWLKRTPDPIGQQARWLEQIEEFDFVIEHRSGNRHGNADALSRRACIKPECLCELRCNSEQEPYGDDSPTFGGSADRQGCETQVKLPEVVSVSHRRAPVEETYQQNNLRARKVTPRNGVEQANDNVVPGSTVLPWSLQGLQAAQCADKDIECIRNLLQKSAEKPPWEEVALQSRDVKTMWAMWPRLSIRDGLLKRRFESADGLSERWQVVLPLNLRTEFMKIAHGGMTGGHLARRRTANAIQSRAYWPSWSSDLDLFMRQCETCARYHRGKVKRNAPMQVALVGEPWERVSVDITGPHPTSARGNKFILTLVDHFSKWAEAIPLANHKAPTVARALMTHVFSRFGAPRQILTDRGTEFESELFLELMRWMEIDKLRTTAYKPSTNGVVERFHRTLNSMLGKVISDSHRDWDDRLPQVLAAYRASPHSSTGFSPNRLFLGRDTRMPLDLVMGLPPQKNGDNNITEEHVRKMMEQSDECWEIARRHLRVAADRRKASYDIRTRTADFLVGDWVWYWYPRRYQNRSPKWQRCYTGPYLIVRSIAPVNYVLQKSVRSKPFVVHADKIKKCYGSTPVSWLATGLEECGVDPQSNPERETNAGSTPIASSLQNNLQAHVSQESLSVFQESLTGNEVLCDVDKQPRSRKRSVRPPAWMAEYVDC
jgi:transposase InsO family protein